MKKIKKFINENLIEFKKLGCSEIIEMNINEFDDKIVGYLLKNYRFDYKGICIYYVSRDNNIWVENMLS